MQDEGLVEELTLQCEILTAAVAIILLSPLLIAVCSRLMSFGWTAEVIRTPIKFKMASACNCGSNSWLMGQTQFALCKFCVASVVEVCFQLSFL